MAIACEAHKSIKANWFESQVRFTNIHGWTIINELNDVHLTKRTYVRMGGLPLFFLLDEPLLIPSISSFYWRLL